MQTPFFDRIQELSQQDVWLHVPGHKGNPSAIPPFGNVLPYDLTEIEGADDLQHPEDTLAQSEANMTAAFDVGASLYTTFGCSCAIKAMLSLFLKPGKKLLLARGCHVSAVNALAFLGAEPVWVYPDAENTLSLSEVELALQKEPEIAAIYVTSPNYEGFLSNISDLAGIAHRKGIPLLVDNAHGAHLRFCSPNLHPLAQGADACADSIHKTLPCLTGAALLQLRRGEQREKARWMLNFHGGTSPSYLTLCSMDLCAGMLLEAPPDYKKTAEQIGELVKQFPRLILHSSRRDPCKITLCPTAAGYETEQFIKALCKAGIFPEYSNDRYVVLMANPYNTPEAFSRLQQVLIQFPAKAPLVTEHFVPTPYAACSLREAMLSEIETVSVEKAVGRIAARVLTPCPPGVPVVVPGERIDKDCVSVLRKSGIFQLDVVK